MSIKEGSAASVMVGTGDSYIIPYAVELGVSNFQTGILAGIVNLFGPLAQIFGSKLMEKTHRQKITTISVALQASSWFLFVIIGLIFLLSHKTAVLTVPLIIAYLLYSIFGSVGAPAWFSMVGDAVPEEMRGRYFSKRNKILNIFSVTSTILAAVCLYYFKQIEIIYGFIILFTVAALARYVSAYYFTKHYAEDLTLDKDYYFSFWRFIKKIPRRNFNKFSLYIGLINFATNIAGPFFNVYMWKVLQFNPIWFTLVNISTGVFSFFFFPFWGKFADKYGNRELLRLGSILIIPLPLFWLFSGNPIYLMFIPQLLSGLGWSAFNLASSNFIYDSIKPQQRALCVSYYNVMNGIGIFFGSLLGGLIVQFTSWSFINNFFLVFIISSVIRLMAAVLILPKVKEVREKHHPTSQNPLNYLNEIRPIYGSLIDRVYPLKLHRFLDFKKIFFRK